MRYKDYYQTMRLDRGGHHHVRILVSLEDACRGGTLRLIPRGRMRDEMPSNPPRLSIW